MSFILKFLGGAAGPYLLGAVLVLLITGFASCTVQSARLATERSELSAAQQNLKTVMDDNANNEKIVASLQSELNKWRASAEKAAHADDQLVQQQKEQAQELTEKDQKLATQQEAIDRALPNCQKLLTLDISRICPGHTAVDRLRAADRLSRPGNKGANPGNSAH